VEILDEAMLEGKMGWDSLFFFLQCWWKVPLFESHSPALAQTFYYDQTESHAGKKYSILIICIDEILNLHQIGKLCTVHKRTHMIFMNSICNPC
jgi:hypothetical protein